MIRRMIRRLTSRAAGISVRGMRRALALLLVTPLVVASALAEESLAYLDDRSDPAGVVRSYYNAVARQEYARAYGYLATPPDYAQFVAGYAETARVELVLGAVTTEGAAGSIYGTVPAAIRATSASGEVTSFAGCYTTRQVQPAIQEPPFRPIEIVEGHLAPVASAGPLADAVPTDCAERAE